MSLECLEIDHSVHIASTQTDAWFAKISPLKMVPAIEGMELVDRSRTNVSENCVCLRHMSCGYDTNRGFNSKNKINKA